MNQPDRGRWPWRAWVLLSLVAAGWLAGCASAEHAGESSPTSPAQSATASPATVVVERKALVDEIRVSGLAQPQGQRQHRVRARPEGQGVVTALVVHAGDPVELGRAFGRVDGEPVIIIPGAFPPYRDLVVGDQGDDVQMLEELLSRRGLLRAPDRVADMATRRAVDRLFRDLGQSRPALVVAPASEQFAGGEASSVAVPLLSAAEWVTVPEGSVISAVGVAVGDTVVDAGSALTVGSGQRELRVELSAADRARVRPGVVVEAVADEGGTFTGAVTSIRDVPPSEGTADSANSVSLVLTEPSIAALGPVDLRFVFSATKAHLVVPVSAVTEGSDGGAAVRRLAEDGSFGLCNIKVIATVNGEAAVAPRDACTLAEGERVGLFS